MAEQLALEIEETPTESPVPVSPQHPGSVLVAALAVVVGLLAVTTAVLATLLLTHDAAGNGRAEQLTIVEPGAPLTIPSSTASPSTTPPPPALPPATTSSSADSTATGPTTAPDMATEIVGVTLASCGYTVSELSASPNGERYFVDATVEHDGFVDDVRYDVDPFSESIIATDQLGAELLCQ